MDEYDENRMGTEWTPDVQMDEYNKNRRLCEETETVYWGITPLSDLVAWKANKISEHIDWLMTDEALQNDKEGWGQVWKYVPPGRESCFFLL